MRATTLGRSPEGTRGSITHYDGGPVGLKTLAVACSEEVRTIEEIYEPYLIQCGLLKRTPRGRMVTAKAYRHLNLLLR